MKFFVGSSRKLEKEKQKKRNKEKAKAFSLCEKLLVFNVISYFYISLFLSPIESVKLFAASTEEIKTNKEVIPMRSFFIIVATVLMVGKALLDQEMERRTR
jgi:hypothetical protein